MRPLLFYRKKLQGCGSKEVLRVDVYKDQIKVSVTVQLWSLLALKKLSFQSRNELLMVC